jgi:hypothetical protein
MPMARNPRVTTRIIDSIPIADKIFWSAIPKGMLQLAGVRDPFCCRACSDVDPDEVSAD